MQRPRVCQAPAVFNIARVRSDRRSGQCILYRKGGFPAGIAGGGAGRSEPVRIGMTADQLAKRQFMTPKPPLRDTCIGVQGKEVAGYADISVGTDVEVFFYDPSSPWRRETNENTNFMLHPYFLKGGIYQRSPSCKCTCALRLNQLPKKTLGFHYRGYVPRMY